MRQRIILGGAAIAVLVLIGSSLGYWFLQLRERPPAQELQQATPSPTEPEPPFERRIVIGSSVAGREIVVYSFGRGTTRLLFVGGVHGGYEWNSSLLAYQFIDYLRKYPDSIPKNLTVDIIPALNPDGLAAVVGTSSRFAQDDVPDPKTRAVEARFNANGVDLNRNFDCAWAPTSTWRGQVVNAGSAPFSEPESRAMRDFVQQNTPVAAVFWHSQANNVYGSACGGDVLPETLTLMETYARAARYGTVPLFDAYPVTGDAESWLASLGIPAITVELERHDTPEWERNRAGIEAVLRLYAIGR